MPKKLTPTERRVNVSIKMKYLTSALAMQLSGIEEYIDVLEEGYKRKKAQCEALQSALDSANKELYELREELGYGKTSGA